MPGGLVPGVAGSAFGTWLHDQALALDLSRSNIRARTFALEHSRPDLHILNVKS
jgi:hypothetical protein